MNNNRVEFYSYGKLVFCWPAIIVGFITDALLSANVSPELAAWIFLLVNALVFIGVTIDINRDEGLVWFLIIGFATTFSILLGYWGFPILHWFWQFLAWLDPTLAPGLGTVWSLILTICFVISFVWRRLNFKWVVTHNEWVREAWFKRAESFARQQKTFYFDYPDLLEFLLLGAGSIEIRDEDGQHVLARINHIPFVGHVFGKIDHLLEHMSTDEHEPPPK